MLQSPAVFKDGCNWKKSKPAGLLGAKYIDLLFCVYGCIRIYVYIYVPMYGRKRSIIITQRGQIQINWSSLCSTQLRCSTKVRIITSLTRGKTEGGGGIRGEDKGVFWPCKLFKSVHNVQIHASKEVYRQITFFYLANAWKIVQTDRPQADDVESFSVDEFES